MKVLYDRVLLRLIDASKVTRGGLILPDVALDNTAWRYAEVVEVGHGRIAADGTTKPLATQKGDLVLFFRNASSGRQVGVPVGDEELIIAVEADIGIILDASELKRATGLVGLDGLDIGLKDAMVLT